MKVFKSLQELSQAYPETSWAILMGNFDGLHLGHQDLIRQALRECEKQGLDLVILSFNPHPICILMPGYKPFLINTYEQKKNLINENKVKFYIERMFTRDLSTQSPGDFLEKELLEHQQLKALYFGYDFAFGANKKGNFSFVEKYCENRVSVKKFNVFKVQDLEVSSSLIRKSLAAHDMESANKYLGRNFYLEGLVTKGEGRGRKIGFPTANLSFDGDLVVPAKGVYTTYTLLRGMKYKSITNIGVNPTFLDQSAINVETHIFDFDDDLYGETIKVCFESFIRAEKKFSSVNELISQIEADCIIARK